MLPLVQEPASALLSRAPAAPSAPPAAGARLATRLGAAEVAWLLLLGPLVLLPGRILPMAWHWLPVAALFLFWPLRWALLGTVAPRTPVRLAGALLALSFAPALLVSVYPDLSWEMAGYHLYGVAWGCALVAWPVTQRRPAWVATALAALTLGLALIGPLLLTPEGTLGALLAPLQRAAGPLGATLGETINPNILAHGLLAGLPLLLALALFGGWSRARGWGQAAAALAALLAFAVVLLTNSRGVWLALLVVIPLLLVLRWRTLLYALPLLLTAAATLIVVRGPQLLELLTAGAAGTTGGFGQRAEIWQRGLALLGSFPLSGVGLGAFAQIVPTFFPYDLIPPTVFVPDAHNLPIQVGVDLGVPGLVAWLAFTILLLLLAARTFRAATNPHVDFGRAQAPLTPRDDAAARQRALTRTLAAGALGSVVGALVAGLFAATNWGVKLSFLPWLVAALIVLLDWQRPARDAVPRAPAPLTPPSPAPKEP